MKPVTQGANAQEVRSKLPEDAWGGGSPSGRLKELEDSLTDALEGAERGSKIVRGLKTPSRAEEERRQVLEVRPCIELAINMAFNEIRHRARLVKDYGVTPSTHLRPPLQGAR